MPHLEQAGLKRLRTRRRHPRIHHNNDGNRQRRRLRYCLEIPRERQSRKRGRLRLIEQRHRMLPAGHPPKGAEYLPCGLNLDVRRERPGLERRMPHELRRIARDT